MKGPAKVGSIGSLLVNSGDACRSGFSRDAFGMEEDEEHRG